MKNNRDFNAMIMWLFRQADEEGVKIQRLDIGDNSVLVWYGGAFGYTCTRLTVDEWLQSGTKKFKFRSHPQIVDEPDENKFLQIENRLRSIERQIDESEGWYG